MPSPFANFHFSPAGCSYEGPWREGESREVDGVQGCCDCIQALSPASCLNSETLQTVRLAQAEEGVGVGAFLAAFPRESTLCTNEREL